MRGSGSGRQWVADHDGLFLTKRPGVENNAFLEQGQLQDERGTWLVKRNSAMVIRELSASAAREGMRQFNGTSLPPVNPANAPDDFERRGLETFETGVEETVEIEIADTGPGIAPPPRGGGEEEEENLAAAVAGAERRCIQRALEKTGGNKTEAAGILGISRKNLREKMKRYGG